LESPCSESGGGLLLLSTFDDSLILITIPWNFQWIFPHLASVVTVEGRNVVGMLTLTDGTSRGCLDPALEEMADSIIWVSLNSPGEMSGKRKSRWEIYHQNVFRFPHADMTQTQ
jgi:hypothetical protein